MVQNAAEGKKVRNFNTEQGRYCNKLVYLTSRITALGRMQH